MVGRENICVRIQPLALCWWNKLPCRGFKPFVVINYVN